MTTQDAPATPPSWDDTVSLDRSKIEDQLKLMSGMLLAYGGAVMTYEANRVLKDDERFTSIARVERSWFQSMTEHMWDTAVTAVKLIRGQVELLAERYPEIYTERMRAHTSQALTENTALLSRWRRQMAELTDHFLADPGSPHTPVPLFDCLDRYSKIGDVVFQYLDTIKELDPDYEAPKPGGLAGILAELGLELGRPGVVAVDLGHVSGSAGLGRLISNVIRGL